MWPFGNSSSIPIWVLVTNSTPSSLNKETRRSTTPFSSFMLGMPYISSPPMRSARSKTVTWCPSWFNWAAAANPAGPEPTIATRFPVRVFGGAGWIQSSENPRSIMAFSMFLIVTAGSVMPSTHAPSQGAGQVRPVNSGKLLVLWSLSKASRHRPRKTKSFHSGIRLSTGQPLLDWQNGTPQSIHLAPCV